MRIWTAADKEQIKAMLARGCAFSEIGDTMGATRSAIAGLVKRMRDADKPERPKPVAVVLKPVNPMPISRARDGKCRYPFGEGPYTFCGADCADIYCEAHMQICYFVPKDADTYAKKMVYWA